MDRKMQKDLDDIMSWSDKWGIEFNIKKSKLVQV